MSTQRRAETRQNQILRAAEKVFSEKGYHESTISDIAKKAELSDATIYEYFSSKEELLFSIPVEPTKKGKDELEFHLNYIRGSANKLYSFIYHFLLGYQNNPEYASVAFLTLKPNRKFLETETFQLIRETYQIIIDILKEGIESGEFKSDIDPYLVRSLIIGAIENIVVRWLFNEKTQNLLDNVGPLTDQIIAGIVKTQNTNDININIKVDPEGNLTINRESL